MARRGKRLPVTRSNLLLKGRGFSRAEKPRWTQARSASGSTNKNVCSRWFPRVGQRGRARIPVVPTTAPFWRNAQSRNSGSLRCFTPGTSAA